jgi:endonuclease YncB( thermonuclease family)
VLILLAAFVGFLQLLTTDGGTAGTATPGAFPSPTPLRQTPTATATPPPFTHPDWQSLEQATIAEVIDGDTIRVLMSGEHQRVRYYGIDTPEKGEKCYQEATERNRELVGTTVRLEADARNEDVHGRLLRYVFTNDGLSVDAALVSEGLAKAWREDGRYMDRLTILETYAREHEVGCLWR